MFANRHTVSDAPLWNAQRTVNHLSAPLKAGYEAPGKGYDMN